MKAKMAEEPRCMRAGLGSYGLQERETNVTNVISMMRIIIVGDSAAAMEFVDYSETATCCTRDGRVLESAITAQKIREYVAQVPYGITAGDNGMIQNGWLDGVVDDLNIRNPVFGEFYERYFSPT